MITEDKVLKRVANEHLQNLVSNFNIIEEAAIVSSDGYLVCKYESKVSSMERVGTMGSSMISLADTMTAELKMGKCVNLVIENELGIAVIIHINSKLSIITVTRETSQLGMLLSATKKYAVKIKQAIT
ncbi:MAG: hypothetical protein HWE27_14560 [Gammaproteobacteria bacterium]|nr:hypothetical protein [Gammaproteobacteria bacterium]